jgi:lipoprotein-anchoring transpeptidase ErfK/SrfK
MEERVRPSLLDARIVVELGRYIVGECGVYVTRVVDRKESRGRTFLIVDGGLHHQLAASGNFGQVIRRDYPVAIGKASTPTPAKNWRIDEKYTYSEWGVYGPRRMRLYKQTGPSSFAYTGYGIHGTNQEWVIGTMASHGCIRMYNKDILDLYPQVPLYTMVQTRE